MTSNLTANFLKILQLSFKLLSRITLIIQLLLQLRDISSSTHLTDLRWSWLEFGSWLEWFLQICDLVSGLLLIPLLFKSSIIFWIFYFEIIEVGGNEFFFSFLHRCSNLWWLWFNRSSTHSCALLALLVRFQAGKSSLAQDWLLWWGLTRCKFFVKSLQASLAKLAFGVSLVAVCTGHLIESLYTAIFTTSLRPLRCRRLSLINQFALSSITKIACLILFLLHLGHLSCHLWDNILSKLPLARSNSLLHLLCFEAKEIWISLKSWIVTY